jgi:ZIP family zinc transporter
MSLQAALWGLVGGSALIVGAALTYVIRIPPRIVAAVMALGAGVLISAVAFELMEKAFRSGGFVATAGGFLTGAAVFTVANVIVSRHGARHRKRSGSRQKSRQPTSDEGAGLAIAIGSLLDGIPESVVIGASLLGGPGVSMATVAAVFLSNVPEGLSSAAGMRKAGRSPVYVFGVWTGITIASGIAAMIGNIALVHAQPEVIAAVTATAAGAILAMLADTMMPEAFEVAHDYAGMITVIGFLAAFALSKLGG